MTKQKKVILISLILTMLLVIGTVIGIVCYENHLDKVQQNALLELEEKKGEYNENKIVLSDTSKKEAEKLAKKLGAKLRITKNGQFATLTLPEGVLVEDVYKDDNNRKHLEGMSLDYPVKLADMEETTEGTEGTTEEEEVLHRPNYIVEDGGYHLQTYLNYINIGDVWNNTLGKNNRGGKVKVAVIDTGIDTDHPEFFDKNGNSIISKKSYDATKDMVVEMYNLSIIEDTDGHGTAVASVIASQMNGVGIVGIAPEIELIVIKCETDENGGLSSADLNFGIYYAIEQDVDVINMSFGSQGEMNSNGKIVNPYETALQLAVDSDIIPVAAAGNDSSNGIFYPAADANVIGVGALAQDSWLLADYSNYGVNSDIVAHGTTYTASIGGGYTYKNGTSLSCPIVTSAVALYVAHNKYVNYVDIKADLLASGKDLGELGEDDYYGFGCLDVNAFILEEKGKIVYDYSTDDIESTTQVFVKQHTIQTVPEPEREHLIFDDWYYDKAYRRVFNYEEYYTTEFVEDITLYAKWTNEEEQKKLEEEENKENSVYTYRTLRDGTIELTGYKGKLKYLTIPDTIDGKTVSSIRGAFIYNTQIHEVTLPKGLTSIGRGTFLRAKRLRKVTFTGDQLESIEESAFENCSSLTEITIPDSVQKIGGRAFLGCSSLNAIGITKSSNLTNIGENAFSKTAITSLYIPKKANFDAGILEECENMRSVTVHSENPNYIVEDSTVYNADKTILIYYPSVLNSEYVVIDSVLEIADNAFYSSNVTKLSMSNNVTSIGKCSFKKSNIKSINLSEGLTQISDGAFEGSRLYSINIPENIELIDKNAFKSCTYLRTLTFSDESALKQIGDYAFSSCSKLQNFIFPQSLTQIGISAFENCTDIQKVVFPKNINYVGHSAFNKCGTIQIIEFAKDCLLTELPRGLFRENTLLRKVVLSDQIKEIGERCFYSCTNLSEVIFTEDSELSEIKNYAFYSCFSLEKMDIPKGVTIIGDYAYCYSGLKEIKIGESLISLGKGALGACYDLTTITVDESNLNFKAINNVLFNYDITTVYCVPSSRSGSYTLPESVKVISPYALYYCKYLEEVVLPSQLEDIQDSSFYYCTKLAKIEIPSAVFDIGRQAFYCCYNLKSATFAENSVLQRLGMYTFYNCGLESFTVPASVTGMAQYVFYKCYDLRNITFEKNSNLTSVSAYMFKGCNSLKNIIFEDGSKLTSIQARGFDGIKNLESIDFGNAKIESIGNYAFYNAIMLKELVIPDTVTYIGRYAFYNCRELERFNLPVCIDYIGNNAFNNGLNNIKVFFESESLPEYAQEGWDNGIADYFLNAKDYVQTDIWDYIVTFNNTISLVRYKGKEVNLIIDSLDGMIIEKLGSGVFENNDSITSIILSSSIREIGNYAFYGCDNLSSLNVPSSVESIGKYAFASSKAKVTFEENSSLTKIEEGAFSENITEAINLPDTVTSIGNYAFKNSALNSIIVSKNSKLSAIGKEAFVGTSISSIYLPSTLTLVDNNAFEDVVSLTDVTIAGGEKPLKLGHSAFNNTGISEITIPKNVYYIGEYTFAGNGNLQNIYVNEHNESYTLLNGMLCDIYGTTLIQYPSGREGAIQIPAQIQDLSYASFKDAKNITEVSFENGSKIKVIGYQTFSGCTALTKVIVPDSVTTFGDYAFENCTSLTDVILGEGTQLTGVYEGAFYNCTSLKNISLSSAVAEISDYAFYNCKSLENVPLGEDADIKLIGAYAFSGCEKISSIPDYPKLEKIMECAFEKTGIKEYTVPASVEEISSYAFDYSMLENIYADEENKKYTSIDGILMKKEATGVYESLDMVVVWPYQRIYVLGNDKSTINVLDTVLIKRNIVKDNYVWADTVTKIGNSAFANCNIFANFVIPEGITSIGNTVFYGCDSLETIMIPESVTTIGGEAFKGCHSLTICFKGETLPASLGFSWNGSSAYYTGVKEIVCEDDAIYTITYDEEACLIKYKGASSTYNIKESINGYNVIEIGKKAFYKCSTTEVVNVPSSVTTIADRAFDECYSLIICFEDESLPFKCGNYWNGCSGYYVDVKEIVYEEDAIYVITNNGTAYFAKYNGDSLTCNIKETINGYTVTEIGAYSFFKNRTIKNVKIPDNVTTIGAYAFSYCSSIVSITIPESVITIGDSAFSYCSSIVSITIPEGVVTIGGSAFFGCYGLEQINFNAIYLNDLPSKNSVFGLSGSKSYGIRVVIGNRVARIPSHLFCDSYHNEPANIVSVEFEDNSACTIIEIEAFMNCSKLTSITIPESIKTIGINAFENCTSLEEIKFNAKDMNDSNGDLFGCAGQETDGIKVIFGKNVTQIPAYLFSSYNENKSPKIIGVRFEEGSVCEKIKKYAFKNCVSLAGVLIPESITTIENNAFADCNSPVVGFNEKNMPSSLGSNLSNQAVCYTDVKDLILENDVVYMITNDGKASCARYYGRYMACEIKESVKGYSVTEISKRAFYNCDNIRCVTIPESITTIGTQAFDECLSLTIGFKGNRPSNIGGYEKFKGFIFDENALYAIDKDGKAHFEFFYGDVITYDIKKNINGYEVTYIAGDAFVACEPLSCVTIPESITNISDRAFYNCESLVICFKSKHLPSSLGNAWNIKLPYYTNIKELVDDGKGVYAITYDNKAVFAKCYYDSTYNRTYDVQKTINGYTVTTIGEKAFLDCKSLYSVKISENVTKIGREAFSGCYLLKSIDIPNSVTSIGDYAFFYCENLTSIEIPNSVTSIGDSMFSGCRSLTSIYISNSVTSIGVTAFGGCRSLTSIEIPNSVTSIGYSAFSGCRSLTSIEIPNGVTSIVDGMFGGCQSLTSIYIPNSVTFIGNSAFSGCRSLTSIEIPNSVTFIGNSAFYGCESLTSIEIPNSVTTIGDSAFGECQSLTNIEIPNGVTFIGDGMFSGCRSLTSIKIPNSVTSIGEDALRNCTSLTCIEIPNGVTSIGNRAFYNCSSLTGIFIPRGVTTIEKDTFYNCTSISWIKINSPIIISSIDENSFVGKLGSYVQTIVIPKDTQDIGFYILDNFADVEEIIFEGEYYISYSKHSHNWILKELTQYIECEQDGVNLQECEWCRVEKKELKNKHDILKIGYKAPTCVGIGHKAYEVCSRCDYSTYVEIEATGHSYTSEVTLPCVRVGYTTFTCHCGESYIDNYVDALGYHIEVVDLEKRPTCEKTGLTSGKHCSVCDEIIVKQVIVPATGHNYLTRVTLPTCTENGYTIHNCYCGNSYVDGYVEPLGHTEIIFEAVEATCTESGLTEGRYCSTCNKVFSKQEIIRAKGHSLVIYKRKDPTCIEPGYDAYEECSVCDYTTFSNSYPLTGHYYEKKEILPTCISDGYITYTCYCGDSYKKVIPSSLDLHSSNGWILVREPTDEQEGLKHMKCVLCGVVIREKVIPITEKILAFREACDAIDQAFDIESRFNSIQNALKLYNSLSKNDKEAVSKHYNSLSEKIEQYNEDIECVNKEHNRATRMIVVMSTLSVVSIGLYFAKRFF